MVTAERSIGPLFTRALGAPAAQAPAPTRPIRVLRRLATGLALAGVFALGPGLACTIGPALAKEETPSERANAFGTALAEAARDQISYLVLYDPSYRKLSYPGGDVPWYIGVCTDVIVRAYRTLGVDLQVLVHKARVGSGDTNIDHRRVPVLKSFFAKSGQTLAITKNKDDYLPGDIVTYHLPDGRFSKTHIGIVSTRKSAEGVPLLVHNRGIGVHEEDWLFAERITGHYRYTGPRR